MKKLMTRLWKGIRRRKRVPMPNVRVAYGDYKPPPLSEQIEAWPKINRKEMNFGYNSGESIAAITPEKGRGSFKSGVILERAGEYEHLVHTHLQRPKAEIARNAALSTFLIIGLDFRGKPSIMPSKQDIIMYALAKNFAVKRLNTSNTVKDLTLSVISRKGKEIGRISIEVPQEKLIKIAERYWEADKKGKKKMQGAFEDREFHQWIRENNAAVRFIPSKGYEFDYNKEIFVRTKKK